MEREEWEIGSCDSCRFKNIKVQSFRRDGSAEGGSTHAWLCELCAGSYAGIAYDYGHPQYRIAGLICHVGNAIIQELRKGRQE